jgi:hypothetical protein
MMRKLLPLLLLASCAPAFATLTASDATTDVTAPYVGINNPTVNCGTVAVGDAIILAWEDLNETATVSSIVGSVNATGYNLLSGVQDHPGTNFRTAVYGRISAGAGTETITVNLSTTTNGILGCSVVSTTAGAITFGTAGTIAEGGGISDFDTNTISAAAPGGVMGIVFTQSEINVTCDGAGETDISNELARGHYCWEPYASGGTKGLEVTGSLNSVYHSHIIPLIEASASGGLLRRRRP